MPTPSVKVRHETVADEVAQSDLLTCLEVEHGHDCFILSPQDDTNTVQAWLDERTTLRAHCLSELWQRDDPNGITFLYWDARRTLVLIVHLH